MAKTITELRNTSTEQLVREHDELAKSTIMGLQYYLDELRSRENERLAMAMERFTRWIFWLTLVVTGATIVQLILAFVPRN